MLMVLCGEISTLIILLSPTLIRLQFMYTNSVTLFSHLTVRHFTPVYFIYFDAC